MPRPRASEPPFCSEATRRQALRGPDGSMHETVDGMLEEFEKASISFQGCLYSFVFCLLVYAWSQASPSALCVLLLTAMALVISYSMISRTSEVEATFPLYSIPLVSGAFFSKKAGSGAYDPVSSLQTEGQAADSPAATSAAPRPPPSGHEAGTPVLMADRAPALPPAIAARHAEQQRLVAEARTRALARKAADKDTGKTRQKDAKWYQRLRDR